MRDGGERVGQVVVTFVARRNGRDEAGYAAAAERMDSLAATQPGYRGVDSVRDAEGLGITLSYWADAASAIAWRDHPEHAATREQGRERWYDFYAVTVATVTRDYWWRAVSK